MKIAVIGTGISGMVAAYLLHREHDITVFEAGDYIGGHTNTVRAPQGDRYYDVDTGFIVFNERTYPNFVRLLDLLGVASRPTTMSFSVKCERTGLEYGSCSLNALFAQRRNLVSPSFHRMLRDLLRFNREAPRLLAAGDEEVTLGGYLRDRAYSRQFIHNYLVPMGAAIWSAEPSRMLEFPARHFVRFFGNHGLLSLNDQPRWKVVRGGSRRYVEKLTATYRDRIRLRRPVEQITRRRDGVALRARGCEVERFDRVVFATHSDQALRMLSDPSDAERDILGAIPYQENKVVLHTDASLLPVRRPAWAAWNYRIPARAGAVAVTYNMNILQGLEASQPFCVTLNHPDAIDPARILKRMTYHHPIFTSAAVAAQKRHAEIDGVNRTHYCGAYWGFGFHEDGVRSALTVCRKLGLDLPAARKVVPLGRGVLPGGAERRSKDLLEKDRLAS